MNLEPVRARGRIACLCSERTPSIITGRAEVLQEHGGKDENTDHDQGANDDKCESPAHEELGQPMMVGRVGRGGDHGGTAGGEG